ncbi:hypothetical protein MRX96_047940 [Rhipicephalus microplus]
MEGPQVLRGGLAGTIGAIGRRLSGGSNEGREEVEDRRVLRGGLEGIGGLDDAFGASGGEFGTSSGGGGQGIFNSALEAGRGSFGGIVGRRQRRYHW